ncbi:hypothetical protein BGY98DRAFT_1104316 [Russula aff. rugulosa BPL654]|nr:hypothetical protein BGY98DRAFT_1104316 [Russula aff. rugulosa BPL654]
MFEKLRSNHERQGAFAKLQLLLKGLKIQFSYDKPLRDTLADLRTYAKRIIAMGPSSFAPLQHSVSSLSNAPILILNSWLVVF